jgi:acetyl-CoA C-acetyltransferase
MIVNVTRDALTSAGLDGTVVDGIWLGHFNAGLVPDAFAASLALGADDALRFVPATRCENACASGSAAIHAARNAIAAGKAKVAVVIGAEKMSHKSTPDITDALGLAGYYPAEAGQSFPAAFAKISNLYFQRYGDQSSALAQIAAKNHKNALGNPLAQMRKDIGFDFCNRVSEKNPMIAPPLRMTDCSLISDGAAAIVLVAEDMAGDFDHAIGFRAAVQVNDFLPMSRRDLIAFEGPSAAFQRAYTEAGVTVADLDFAEVHDCFTIAELLVYEAMGITPAGRGADAIESGTVSAAGALPVNLSGGLKAKGHPIGATGVSMHVMAAMQLTGTAGEMQRKGAELGCVFNMGGSAVANYVSILERTGGKV